MLSLFILSIIIQVSIAQTPTSSPTQSPVPAPTQSPLPSTCDGYCGGTPNDLCFCDDLCEDIGDCCEDACQFCSFDCPIPNPTSSPTPNPTSSPTPNPTSSPTSSPTSAPTIFDVDCKDLTEIKTFSHYSIMWNNNNNNYDFTFEQANKMCQCRYNNLTLATVSNQEENDLIWEYMLEYMKVSGDEYKSDDLYIGLNRFYQTTWEWVDGNSDTTYIPWHDEDEREADSSDEDHIQDDDHVAIDRQLEDSNGNRWFGRGRKESEQKNIRWFLCETREDECYNIKNDQIVSKYKNCIKSSSSSKTILWEILIPSVSGGLVLCMGFLIWVLKRFFNIVVFRCCDLRLEAVAATVAEGAEGVSGAVEGGEIELVVANAIQGSPINVIDEIIGDAEIIIND